GDRDRGTRAYVGVSGDVGPGERLLEPADVVRFERRGDLDRLVHDESGMTFDEQFDLRTDCAAYGGDDVDRPLPFGPGEFTHAGAERVELECRIPTIDGFAGQFGETLRCALAGVPAVRVDADLVATRATDEAIDRDTEQLSLDVVQRLVDAAHDDPADVAAAQEVALVHAEPDLLGVERIGTDQMAFAHVASEGAGLGAAKRVSD